MRRKRSVSRVVVAAVMAAIGLALASILAVNLLSSQPPHGCKTVEIDCVNATGVYRYPGAVSLIGCQGVKVYIEKCRDGYAAEIAPPGYTG